MPDYSYKGTVQAERQALLDIVRRTQTEFWEAVRNLELAYGPDAEIFTEQDFQDVSIGGLDDDMRDRGFHVVDSVCPGE